MSPAARRATTGTAARILELAERLVQQHGFNGFSFAHIAAELGIRKASVHHHYRTKAELGAQLIQRYRRRFAAELARIDRAGGGARAALQGYADLYADALRGDRMCLCGMMAAEITALPRPMRTALRRFFDENEDWLARVLEAGRRARDLEFAGSPRAHARLLLAALEGAMLVTRSYRDAARFESTVALLLAGVGAARQRAGRRGRR